MTLETYLKQHYTKATAKSYSREIEIYQSNYKQAETAIYKDIVNYLGVLRIRYSKPATLSRILSSIKVYYDYLSHCGKRRDNPAKSIKLRDKQNRDVQLQDLFTTVELEQLLERKERYITLSYRNKVLISLLIYQGLHPKEMADLTIKDINLEQATIYIKSSSKTNGRELKLKSNQILLFHHYINEIRPKLIKAEAPENLLLGHRKEPMKREDITKHVKRTFKKAFENRRVNCQTIRQSVITNLLNKNNDLRVVQVFAGHKYTSTTERYKQTDLEALKTAVQKHHPIK